MKPKHLCLLAIILLIPACVWAWGVVGIGGGVSGGGAETFGNTTEESSSQNEGVDFFMGSRFTSGSAGNIRSVKGIICTTSGTIISNGVSDANTSVTTSLGWWDLTFSTQPSVSASTVYILAIIANGDISLRYGGSGDGHWDSTNSYASPQNADGTDDSSNRAIYATYN
jgi:hypothetical protein